MNFTHATHTKKKSMKHFNIMKCLMKFKFLMDPNEKWILHNSFVRSIARLDGFFWSLFFWKKYFTNFFIPHPWIRNLSVSLSLSPLYTIKYIMFLDKYLMNFFIFFLFYYLLFYCHHPPANVRVKVFRIGGRNYGKSINEK